MVSLVSDGRCSLTLRTAGRSPLEWSIYLPPRSIPRCWATRYALPISRTGLRCRFTLALVSPWQHARHALCWSIEAQSARGDDSRHWHESGSWGFRDVCVLHASWWTSAGVRFATMRSLTVGLVSSYNVFYLSEDSESDCRVCEKSRHSLSVPLWGGRETRPRNRRM